MATNPDDIGAAVRIAGALVGGGIAIGGGAIARRSVTVWLVARPLPPLPSAEVENKARTYFFLTVAWWRLCTSSTWCSWSCSFTSS